MVRGVVDPPVGLHHVGATLEALGQGTITFHRECLAFRMADRTEVLLARVYVQSIGAEQILN
jgi:hypothetical protein